MTESLSFAAICNHHGHLGVMAQGLRAAGARCRLVWDADGQRLDELARLLPEATPARCLEEVLEHPQIRLVCAADIPEDRADLGLRVMAAGKHYLTAKPGLTTDDQLQRVRAACRATGRRYLVYFSERFHSEAAVAAEGLVRDGRIGRVLHLVGLGPHRLGGGRPSWFFDRRRSGGIISDLGSHQIDQFLTFAGVQRARVLSAHAANHSGLGVREGFQDLGEACLGSDEGPSAYFRVDWFSPGSLPTWGDSRTILTGSEGYLEIRRTIDLGTDNPGNLVLLVDRQGTHRIACGGQYPLPFCGQLIRDLSDGTELALTQEHVFRVMEACLEAQRLADREH